jgi:hypothetical protein
VVSTNRLWENHFGTAELRWLTPLEQEDNIHVGCSKRPPSNVAASEEGMPYSVRYGEPLSDAGKKLALFFSILLS